MGPTVHQAAVHRAGVFGPLPLNKDQRPLPWTESVMLQPGQGEVFLLAYPITSQRTPSGKASVSTVTV